ncbi:E3 ubiquitin-protein ligase Midline-1-like [Mya arenaria]|uniref:E3 ubiquitin-protein ligase Midline-1-like n=1 Tax=Mya arenaria TaxID=6604 RepID=UPI0022E223D4|nr:E3 ubiquitin-protein ligase Midline-1-like [Mya arenaria]
MEAGGRKSDNANENASNESVLHCQPCLQDGRELNANGFCKICKEFMCDPCISAHKRFAMSRNHVFLTKDKMPSFYMNKDKADFLPTEPCLEHRSEMIKYYCPTHDDFGCSVCIVLHHRNCKVEYLLETAKQYKESEEYNTLNENIAHMETVLSALNNEVNDSEAFVTENTKEEIQKLRNFRAEINLVLDTKENMLLKDMKENEIKQKEILSKLRVGITGLKQTLAETTTGMQTTQNQLPQHFIHAKMAKKQLVKLQGGLNKINAEIILDTSVRCTFLTDELTKSLINSSDILGRVDFSNEGITSETDIDLSTVEWTKDTELDISCTEDTSRSLITRSALVEPGKCLLADNLNACVTLVDINDNKVLSRIELLGRPWQMCALPSGHAAVALPNECKVQFMSIANDLVIAGAHIGVSGSCYGLAYNDKSLFVSCVHDEEAPADYYVERLTITGEVLQSFTTKIGFARNITVSSSSIYLSGLMRILQLDFNGSLLNTYDDPLVTLSSESINVGKERILVLARRQCHIVLINGKERNLKVILSLKDFGSLNDPHNLSFCPVSRKLLAGLEVFSAVI